MTYVNDSKATNVEATLTALNAYPERTHLILGGRDKASDYRPVARACARGCKAVYLIGEATPLIEAAFAEVREQEGVRGVPEVRDCGDLERAVWAASEAAVAGDVVLLAPACASFDQYGSFEERGEHFRASGRASCRRGVVSPATVRKRTSAARAQGERVSRCQASELGHAQGILPDLVPSGVDHVASFS